MACQARGIDVPRQLAVAGFGDFEVARVSNPGISTVSVDAREIGRLTARAMLEAIGLKTGMTSADSSTLLIPFEIKLRDSVR
jgi:LacI family gluconate utilization system Gnt-I transcriptional repressor